MRLKSNSRRFCDLGNLFLYKLRRSPSKRILKDKANPPARESLVGNSADFVKSAWASGAICFVSADIVNVQSVVVQVLPFRSY